jgi:uncharacterized repeat protein (TIGR03847 family)
VDLGPVDRITADAVGEPGSRTFYIQARAGTELVTVIVEKQQVQLLAASVLELLAQEEPPAVESISDEATMALEEPLDPRWRAGRLSIGFDQERNLFLLEVEEYRAELDDEGDLSAIETSVDTEHEPESIRLWASAAQMLALSRHGAAVAARGRPTCQFCGNPIDPEGHVCPAMNGHSVRA